MVRKLRASEFEAFIQEKTAAAIHFDAEWDVAYRPVTRHKMVQAEAALSRHVNLGEVDVDREMELARSLHLVGVPAVAYYHRGQLIAILVGQSQDVQGRLERVLRGELIGHDDGLDGRSSQSSRLNVLK